MIPMTYSNLAEKKDDKIEDDGKVNVRALMDEIRSKVKSDVELHKDRRLAFNPYKADGDVRAQHKAGELLYSEELRYLNQSYAYAHTARSAADKISSHRWGPVGKLIVKIKRKVTGILWDSVLKEYFESEREYQANLVRYLNSVSKYVDARDASNFWELIRKIDYDVTKALDRIERISDEQTGTIRTTERALYDSFNSLARDLSNLQGDVGSLAAKLQVVESVASGLESIVSRASKTAPTEITFPGDQSYLLLENRFRGSEDDISSRLEIYPPIFSSAPGVVLEIGGGRGELQLLFQAAGVKSYNVDIDEAMVASAKAKGVDARLGDGIKHLSELPDKSIGGVIAVQVVEHLPWKVLEALFTLCSKKVKKGGRVIFETINPRSVMALSSNYFRDPTHVWPLHPDTLSYQMSLCGLKIVEVKNLSPVPQEAGISEVALGEFMSPRWAEALQLINRNFSRLHELLYGFQDYCVVAEVTE